MVLGQVLKTIKHDNNFCRGLGRRNQVFSFSHFKTIVLFHVLSISFPRFEDDPPEMPKLSLLTLGGIFSRGGSGQKTIKFTYMFIGSE